MSRRDVIAVLPAFDCEGTVGGVVAGLRRQVATVFVVDDGSRDGTAAEAAAAGAEVVGNLRNQGKGAALRVGVERALAAGAEAIALLDADGQHDPADLPALLGAWEARGPDLVVGSRMHDPSNIPRARYWTNYLGTKALARMTGFELEDSQSGFRLLTATLARRLALRSSGYAIESEMLIKASRAGAKIEQVPVRTIYDGRASHYQPVRDTVRIVCAAIYFQIFDES